MRFMALVGICATGFALEAPPVFYAIAVAIPLLYTLVLDQK